MPGQVQLCKLYPQQGQGLCWFLYAQRQIGKAGVTFLFVCCSNTADVCFFGTVRQADLAGVIWQHRFVFPSCPPFPCCAGLRIHRLMAGCLLLMSVISVG